MAASVTNPDAEVFLNAIAELESQANDYAAFIKKLKSRLSRATKALKSKPAVASQVSALISDLEALKSAPEAPSVTRSSRVLEDELKKLQGRLQELFPVDLRKSCEAAHLAFKSLPDGFAVGPFYVTTEAAKETAAYQFAKIKTGIEVPLNVSAIVDQAAALKASLIDDPVDLEKFSIDLNEAMRVALARQGKAPKSEWRVELPLVLNELKIIRQPQTKRRKSPQAEYSPCRFVVELKEFMQSVDNMRAEQPYRLETAVLENTKNPKKSIFIPRDISRGLRLFPCRTLFFHYSICTFAYSHSNFIHPFIHYLYLLSLKGPLVPT